MDDQVLIATRLALHGVAEQVLAGPQYRTDKTIRLKITPGGFGQVAGPLRIEGTDLVGDGVRVPLRGTVAELAAAVGVEPGVPEGLYSDHADLDPSAPVEIDAAAAAELAGWLARGDQALRALDPATEPVLWPEHFDLGFAVDEVNYGISPGDAGHPRPYAYVGPWTTRDGEFWNAPFGALRPAAELPDVEAVLAFFSEGRAAAAS